MYDSVLPPGVIRCNSTLPCTGFIFQNVKATGWWSMFHLSYFTENVHGEVVNSSPAPKFISKEGDGYVNDDRQYVLVQAAVEYIHDLFFGQTSSGDSHLKLMLGQQMVPDYGTRYKKVAKGFATLYLNFATH